MAPTTLLSSLLFYVGWAHVYWFFRYFGIDSSVLGLTTRDYVMRSVDALFVPLLAAAVSVLCLIWGFALLPAQLRGGPSRRWHVVTLACAGAALMVNGLSRMLIETPVNSAQLVAPMCILLGVAVISSLIWARRTRAYQDDPTISRSTAAVVCEWASLFVIVAINLFWIANDYSAAVGQTRALEKASDIPSDPAVILFSEKELHLDSSKVRETICADTADMPSTYHFRYDGLVLLNEIDNEYVLLPRTWRPGQATAVILPKTGVGATRLEFASPDYQPPAAC